MKQISLLIEQKQNAIAEKLNDLNTKNKEITEAKDKLKKLEAEKRKYRELLDTHKEQYGDITYENIYEIEEELDRPFENLYSDFISNLKKFRVASENRQKSKERINLKLNKDIQDVKYFIREVNEEIINIPQSSHIIETLLNTLSHEIGSPTDSFITQFEHFKTFVYKSYNRKLEEYPISNIEDVKG